MERPRCERKGTLPHPATYALTWDLLSGRVTRFFCDEHAQNARPQPDHISKLIGWNPDPEAVEED
jgi:hypothetical protein